MRCTQKPGEEVKEFLQQSWEFPHAMEKKGKAVWRVFDSYRLADDGSIDKIRASASELLGLSSMLRYYFDVQVRSRPDLAANWLSFDACCDILSIILACKKKEYTCEDAAPLLQGKIASFLQKHVACYGDHYLKPKHPWLWAIAEHFRRDGMVLDCFKVEAMHLVPKASCIRIDNTRAYERSILAGSLNLMMELYRHAVGPCHFIGKTKTIDLLPYATFGNKVSIWDEVYTTGDMVIYQNTAYELLACVLEDDMYYGVVERFSLVRSYTAFGKKWRATGNIQMVLAKDLTLASMGFSVS